MTWTQIDDGLNFSPQTMRRNVVFPAPSDPISAVIFPRAARISRQSTAVSSAPPRESLNRFVTPAASTTYPSATIHPFPVFKNFP